jgi:ATP-dependent Clp protease ATP-binding subunit ClpC
LQSEPTFPITSEVCTLFERVKNLQASLTPETMGHPARVNVWLLALLEQSCDCLNGLVDISAEKLTTDLKNQVSDEGSIGHPLSIEEVVTSSFQIASQGGGRKITFCILVQAVLQRSNLKYSLQTPLAPLSKPDVDYSLGDSDDETSNLRPIPTLLQFGRDLTKEARKGKLNPMVGRERELELMIETLCRRTKRNPVLVGPAGVGKTAIVEGLAQKIVNGDVPQILQGVTVVLLQPSLIVAGTKFFGDLEKRIEPILEEASQPGVILFIDELHMIIGAGGREGTGDIANLMKPALARGDIACIAATTDDEYRRFIESDSALERRFNPVRVQEMTVEQAMYVLRVVRDEMVRDYKVEVRDEVLHLLMDYADCYMHNRNFPDKGIDLLEQSVAYARNNNLTIVEPSDAEMVVQRMMGIPLNMGDRFEVLHQLLSGRHLLDAEDLESLVVRLQVSMRGLDLCVARPNVVVLLTDIATQNGAVLAETISSALFETDQRVVKIDLSQIKRLEDISSLIGTPPGFVGYDQPLPLHQVKQFPWCIILFENLEKCHVHILQILAHSFRTGYLLDAKSNKIYLSDTVVILTAPDIKISSGKGFGFAADVPSSTHQASREAVEKELGEEFVSTVDIICSSLPPSGTASCNEWPLQEILVELIQLYRRYKLEVTWDKSLVIWLETTHREQMSKDEWERLMDETLTPVLLPYLDEGREIDQLITIGHDGEKFVVTAIAVA